MEQRQTEQKKHKDDSCDAQKSGKTIVQPLRLMNRIRPLQTDFTTALIY